jgi:centrosomal protein CEP76
LSIQNVLSENIDAFFAVKITAVDPKRHKNKTEGKLLPQYTHGRTFHVGETFVYENPEELYMRNFFSLSYADLHRHQVQVDMWRTSTFSFNTLHGVGHKNLFQVANGDPNISIFLKKAISPKEAAKKKGKAKTGSVYDVALFQATAQLEEIFDFSLRFENFSFEPNPDHKDYKTWMKSKKALTFVVPRNVHSDPQNHRHCATQSNEWVQALEDGSGFMWKNPLEFVFTGTRTQLTTSCFLVNVSSGGSPLGPHIGKVLLGLTSILEMSVFKGTVKALSTVEKEFNIGKLSGNVRFRLRSKNTGSFVDQLPLGCPMQPSASSLLHLRKKEKHLVVSIKKCEGLPVADPEFGWSDPYLRVSWDNMMKRSWVSPNTTRPVFNINFYFPVRMFSTKLESVRSYRDTALQYELQSKGPVQIMVWDDDPNSSELLGTFTLPLEEILSQTTKSKRTIRGSIQEENPDEVNEFVKPKKLPWYDEVEDVRVYDGGKSVGGTVLKTKMACSTKPLIFFEAYFYPDDWPMGMSFDSNHTDSKPEKWMAKEKAFRSDNKEFHKLYKQAFPESIGALPVPHELGARMDRARRFPCLAENQSLDMVPLPSFLVKIVTPEEYSRPHFLLHWVNCIPFSNDSRQSRSGIIEKWNDPQMLLFARQGSPQDHAILLCSILLGAKRDAYVVKGMVWQKEQEEFGMKAKSKTDNGERWKLCEHAWVMTREANDYVCFWEPCSREIFHLPRRYKTSGVQKDTLRKQALARLDEDDSAEEEDESNKDRAHREEFAVSTVADIQLDLEDIEAMPIIGALPLAGRKEKDKVKLANEVSAAEKMKAALMQQREKLAIAPQRKLLDPEGTLVDWLPYDSIEIVFNHKNVWANHQNHHPSCISYDIDEIGWNKLLKNDAEAQEFKIEHIQQDVVIDAALKPAAIANLESMTITEMQENMRLTRRNQGLDTVFDLSKSMRDYVDLFLCIHEEIRKLDYDLCPLWSTAEDRWTEPMKYTFKLLNKKRPYNRWGSAFQFDDQHKSTQESGWSQLLAKVATFLGMKDQFPQRRGKDFDGVPVHFSTADRDKMRKYLMELREYKKMLEDKQDNTAYVIHCKMFGFLNQITSVWLYFGMHKPSSALEMP